tara:strand:- start:57 stop:419 length:363 start_codon:yes stop_codon:yes gene_type:complete
LDLEAIIYILVGSTFGVMLRMYIKNNFNKEIGFKINNISLINIFASFLLGIFVALDLSENNLLLLYVGFLGCLSTFSSFIYKLFQLFQNRQYLMLILHYLQVLILSFLFFFIGYLMISVI